MAGGGSSEMKALREWVADAVAAIEQRDGWINAQALRIDRLEGRVEAAEKRIEKLAELWAAKPGAVKPKPKARVK